MEEYRAALCALGFTLGAEPAIAPLLDEQWASAWQQSFPPREVGERLLIVPPWETVPTPPGRPIRRLRWYSDMAALHASHRHGSARFV